jgi:enterochelin esterase-like enzyme
VLSARLLLATVSLALLLGSAACQAAPAPGAPAPTLSGAAACAAGQGEVQRIGSVDPAYGPGGDYQVYLPPCYSAHPDRRYPVLYLLHGAGHDDEHWLEVGIDRAADEAIERGRVGPMIVVMPDGGPVFRSALTGAPSFDDYLVDSIVRDVDSRWRTIPDRRHRAIGGISLGGGHALAIAAAFPDAFGSVGGHSAAIRGLPELVSRLAEGRPRIYLDVGDDDSLRSADEELSSTLDDRGIAHEFHVGDGGHEEVYWTAHLDDYLAFYDAGFTGS